MGKAIPYGIYDLASGSGQVDVGADHDTAASTVESIRHTTDVIDAWLRAHPTCRSCAGDSSGAYAEAIRRALPDAIQIADRWHLRHSFGEAV